MNHRILPVERLSKVFGIVCLANHDRSRGGPFEKSVAKFDLAARLSRVVRFPGIHEEVPAPLRQTGDQESVRMSIDHPITDNRIEDVEYPVVPGHPQQGTMGGLGPAPDAVDID